MRFARIVGVVLVIVAILAGEWLWLRAAGERPAGDGVPVSTTRTALGGPFSLVDHFGQAVTDRTYLGKYVVMVFGYTSCPDVCPTTLTSVAGAMALLGVKAQTVQPLFVTVDPERDTPAVLAKYVAAFHPRLVGLSGSPAQIRQMAQTYRVYVAKGETGHDADPVDHSAYVYVIGPDGQMLTYLKPDTTPPAMAQAIGRWLPRQAAAGNP